MIFFLGCSDNLNCPADHLCNDHECKPDPKFPVISHIIVSTASCQGCNYSLIEDGLKLHLVGRFGAECTTDNLDKIEEHDYVSNHAASFNSGMWNDGLGGCNSVS